MGSYETDFEDIKVKPNKTYTLAFITNESQVLLGFKKRGFGEGKWNGFGGKPMPGETINDAAVREIQEECGLTVEIKDMDSVGVIHFEFVGNPVLMKVYVFRCTKFQGTPVESDEMRPKWYPINDIPHKDMWADDEIWYPLMIDGKNFNAYFLFEGFSTILKYCILDFNDPSVVLKSGGY